MSTVDAKKFELVAASFADTFSIFTAGGKSIGEGILISNGVSQLSNLDKYVTSMGKSAEDEKKDDADPLKEYNDQALAASEELAELIEEALEESDLGEEVGVEFNSQYVLLTMNGALLFDSGDAKLKSESMPMMAQIAKILERYADGMQRAR